VSTSAQLFVGLTPLIGVFDMPQSLAFYRDLLGFEVVTASPEVETTEGRFSHWMWLRLGAANLMLIRYTIRVNVLQNQTSLMSRHTGTYASTSAAPTLPPHTKSLSAGDLRLSRQRLRRMGFGSLA